MWIAIIVAAVAIALLLRFKPWATANSTDAVPNVALRNAVTTAGGTPVRFDDVGLLRQLITVWGGTPTYYDEINLLRQAITAAGGTPTQYQQIPLLRQLVTTRGGTPATYNPDKLYEQVASLALLADITAPTLSLPVGTQTSDITATVGATTNEATGTLYYVVTTSATAPTAVQVEAGQNNLGTSAVASGSQAVSSTGAKTASATGLTASTAYFAHLMHKDGAGNRSTVVSSATFTTNAAADTTAPTLSSPVGTQTGQNTATIGATTNEANGTFYGVVTTSATAPTAVQVEAGQNNLGTSAVYAGSAAVGSTGAKTLSATGLTASTAYYAHLMHKDAAGNRSTVVSSASFTTAAASTIATPTLSLVSASGASPLVLGLTTTDDVLGMRGQLQIASDAGFSTITQERVFFIDAESYAELDESIGLTDPAGNIAYYARIRILRDNESGSVTATDSFGATFTADASSWSNTVTDTILVTTTTLDPSHKHSTAALSGGNLTITGANQGSPQNARTTLEVPVSGKVYAEVTITTLSNVINTVQIGVCNAAFAVTTLGAVPGNGNSNGGCVSGNALFPGGTYSGHDQAQGDVMRIAISRTSSTTAKFWIGWNSSWKAGENPATNTGGTSVTISECYGVIAVSRIDLATVNFGATAYVQTKPTGFTAWP